MTELLVGYSSNRKKQKHFFDGLAATARSWVGRCGPHPVSVRLVPLSDEDETCRLHAVIHKRTDDMAAAVAGGDDNAAERIERLERILNQVVSIDPLEGVWRLVDRRLISEAVDRAFGHSASRVRPLRWTSVPLYRGANAIRKAVQGLQFPIILKKRLACGTKASHEMVVAYDMAGVYSAAQAFFSGREESNFGSEAIAQEFIAEHGGVLFKVYAIGDHIVVQPRSSVKSVKTTGGYYHFDSQQLNRGDQANHFSFDLTTGCSKATDAVLPSRAFCADIVAELSGELGLSLIGVDLVFDVRSKRYYVVDINYFPGYKGVSLAYEWILEHICNLVWDSLEQQ